LKRLCLLIAIGLLGGCGYLYPDLPESNPPLADMEEPLELFEEPDDEALRRSLPGGVFTGLYVKDAVASLEEIEEAAGGILVERIVENSPADAARLLPGDLLLSVAVNEDPVPTPLLWASTWRDIELRATPGDQFRVLYDRAGVEREISFPVVARTRSAQRGSTVRYREEERVGLVVRTATEVEARVGGLAPGGGAVVVGLSRISPWRAAGIRFEDLILAVDDRIVAHPQVILDAIREAPEDALLRVKVSRGNEILSMETPVSSRVNNINEFEIPLLFAHETRPGENATSFLLGFIGYRETEAAWEFRLLWFITFRGGDADRLKEVETGR